MSDGEMQQLYDSYRNKEPLLHYYYFLKNTYTPLIEKVILLDRLLYLHENVIT